MAVIETIGDQLLDRRARQPHIFLAGAGVSVDEPSGVPMAAAVIRAFADFYWANEAVRRVWGDCQDEFIGQMSGFWFEKVLSPLPSAAVTALLAQYNDIEPNHYHRFLAAAISRGHFVVTVNFDDGIENAGLVDGMAINAVADVEGLRQIEANVLAATSNTQGWLLKVHGTAAAPESVQALLRDVLRSGAAFAPQREKRRALSALFSRFPECVMGYSASDVVDVWQLLQQTGAPQGLTWAYYSRGVVRVLDRPEDIRENIPRPDLAQFLCDQKATVIFGEARQVFEYAGRRWSGDQAPPPHSWQRPDVSAKLLSGHIVSAPGDSVARVPFMLARTFLAESVSSGDEMLAQRAAALAAVAEQGYRHQQRSRGVIAATNVRASALAPSADADSALAAYRAFWQTSDWGPGLLDLSGLLNNEGTAIRRSLRGKFPPGTHDGRLFTAHSVTQAAVTVAQAVVDTAHLLTTPDKADQLRNDGQDTLLRALTDLVMPCPAFGPELGPGRTCCLTNAIIVVCLKFVITAIRTSSETPPLFSTAATMMATLRL